MKNNRLLIVCIMSVCLTGCVRQWYDTPIPVKVQQHKLQQSILATSTSPASPQSTTITARQFNSMNKIHEIMNK